MKLKIKKRKMLKKSQGAIEFLILFGAIFLFFVAFMLVIQHNVDIKNKEKETLFAHNVALSVQSEISLAAESSDGYYREFLVPESILGKEYSITVTEGIIYIEGDNLGLSYRTLEVNGNIQKGSNVIRKENGVIYLNS